MLHDEIKDFLDFIRDTEQRYRISAEDEQISNDETQDILHMLELLPMDDDSLLKAAKCAVETRKKRRRAKDFVAACTPIVKWAEENRSVIKSLERLLGDVRKEERSTENRFYTPRTSICTDIVKEVEQHG